MTETQEQIEEILYEGLVSLENPQEREDFLEQTCRGNPELRARLEELVSLSDEAETFFDRTPELTVSEAREEVVKTPDGDFTESVGTRIGRYRLLERLGEGGHGVVYQAEQLEPVRRRVALKVIRVGMDTESIIARFEMERQALALMDHPNIARVLDAGATVSGRPFFVMQMVKGKRITDFCDENHLDLPARLRLFIPVCMAIQHAHQKGIIHCDIKPSNILVTLHDGVAVPKVIDFGIAKATESGNPDIAATASQPFIGTPAYMSPEQVDGDGLDVDTRSDIYSLGVVLYELLAGVPPRDATKFRHSSPEEIRNLLRDSEVRAPSARLHSCPREKLREAAEKRRTEPGRLAGILLGDLDAIIMKAMEPDRQQRYGTVNGLAADLSRYLDNEPVTARGAGRRYRLGKLVRRNKVVFAAGAVVALALSGGFGTSTWLFFREAHARQEQARLRHSAEIARSNESKLRAKAQVGETVAHAAVLISHGEIQQADSLLANVDPDNVPASLESVTTFRTVGEWLLHEGRWEEASKRLAAVAQAIARVDKSESDSISIHFVSAAAAVTDAGNAENYERLRQMAADRFSTTTNPIVADEVIKSCLIKPADPELLAHLEPLFKLLEANLPEDRVDAPGELMEAWQMLSLSLASYRKGDFPGAEHWALRGLRHPNQNPSRSAAMRAILAMALYHEGKTDDARTQLDSARGEVSDNFNKPFDLGGSEQGFWFDWIIARILLKEADGVVAR
ncbi:MAG: serine/threonine-protein kinase [Luteolibacter sp.]